MSPSLPVAPARKVIKALVEAGFIEHHTTGSHVILRHAVDHHRRVTIPMHTRDLKPKTMHHIQKQSGLSSDEFCALF